MQQAKERRKFYCSSRSSYCIIVTMIKDIQRQLNQLQVLLDALVLAFSYALAWYFAIKNPIFPEGHGVLSAGFYFSVLIPLIPAYLVLYWILGLYRPMRTIRMRSAVFRIIQSNSIGMLLSATILFAFRKSGYFEHYSTRMLGFFYLFSVFFTSFERYSLRKILSALRKRGFNQKHIILVGYSSVSDRFIDLCKKNPDWGYHIYGIVDDLAEQGTAYRGISVIGKINSLRTLLSGNTIDEIAITLPLAAYEKLPGIVSTCEKSGVHTKFIPDYQEIIHSKPIAEDMDGLPIINIRNVPLTEPMNAMLKRMIDIAGSLVGILLFGPLMIIVAILIKLDSPGPIIFKQERVGLHNRPFMMFKFRSMRVQKDEEEKKAWTVEGDPRVTGIGKIIRKASIDELPQFFNVLRGDMSLIGPRPERTQFVEMFKEQIPRYMIKHQVRPGMTGWAQVNGFRGDTSIPGRIKCDLWYIENWSFGLDIKILFLTVWKGFVNKNAY